MISVTKSYRDLPAAHRQPKHDGHCRQIHGHNWSFDITFVCEVLDNNGFVVDVGKLKEVKHWLERHFDHTLLLNEDDPLRKQEAMLFLEELSTIVVVPNCGMEGLAKFVGLGVQGLIAGGELGPAAIERGLRVASVVCWEDSKNSSTYSV